MELYSIIGGIFSKDKILCWYGIIWSHFLWFRTEQMSKYVSVLEKGFFFFIIGETNVKKGKEKNPIVLDLS